LSSSNGARVLPMIVMAFSYGFGVFPIACKLLLLNEILPSITTWMHWLCRQTVKKQSFQKEIITKFKGKPETIHFHAKFSSQLCLHFILNLPVHSLLFVKSIPRTRFDDSKPSFLKAVVTYI